MTWAQYFKFMLSISAEIQCAISCGYLISSSFPNGATATMMAPILAMPLILLGGFFSNSGSMPSYLTAVQQISPVHYNFSALADNEWSGGEQNDFYKFLALDKSYWECILRFFVLAIILHLLAMIMLKILTSREQ